MNFINILKKCKVNLLDIDEKERKAKVEVAMDQQSLAIGKGGQNVRLAAKLTGWSIDIISVEGEYVEEKQEEEDK